MARYIDADALAEKLRLQCCKGCDNYNGIRCRSCDINFVFDIVEYAPPADVAEVRHGKWIYRDSDLGCEKYECSNCNTLFVFYTGEELSNYCPNCGAIMDG